MKTFIAKRYPITLKHFLNSKFAFDTVGKKIDLPISTAFLEEIYCDLSEKNASNTETSLSNLWQVRS